MVPRNGLDWLDAGCPLAGYLADNRHVALAPEPRRAGVRPVAGRTSDCDGYLGATLLGLYFAGLSFIVTSRYASAPANVRQLMLDERVGNADVRLVSVVVAIALLVIMLEISATTRPLTVGAVALAAATCIVSFGVVGLRVFSSCRLRSCRVPSRLRH